jgi:hypothetical protein
MKRFAIFLSGYKRELDPRHCLTVLPYPIYSAYPMAEKRPLLHIGWDSYDVFLPGAVLTTPI